MMIKRVTFLSSGEEVIGDLHLPKGNGPFPAAIVGGPMTSVKEQVTGTYARALAERGIAGLAIDHRYFGESAGQPRQYEYYPDKISDLWSAIDALQKQPEIKPDSIAALGICLGAGYVAHAIKNHHGIKAFAAVAGYYRDMPAMIESHPQGFWEKVQQGRQAREHYEETGEVISIPAVALDQDAAMTLKDTFDYYGTPRAAVANYVNRFAVMSREHFLQFDVQSAAERLAVPTLMIHSESALSPHWARKFYNAITAEKSEIWLESKNQVDFYDNPALVEPAADQIAKHFVANIC